MVRSRDVIYLSSSFGIYREGRFRWPGVSALSSFYAARQASLVERSFDGHSGADSPQKQ